MVRRADAQAAGAAFWPKPLARRSSLAAPRDGRLKRRRALIIAGGLLALRSDITTLDATLTIRRLPRRKRHVPGVLLAPVVLSAQPPRLASRHLPPPSAESCPRPGRTRSAGLRFVSEWRQGRQTTSGAADILDWPLHHSAVVSINGPCRVEERAKSKCVDDLGSA